MTQTTSLYAYRYNYIIFYENKNCLTIDILMYRILVKSQKLNQGLNLCLVREIWQAELAELL